MALPGERTSAICSSGGPRLPPTCRNPGTACPGRYPVRGARFRFRPRLGLAENRSCLKFSKDAERQKWPTVVGAGFAVGERDPEPVSGLRFHLPDFVGSSPHLNRRGCPPNAQSSIYRCRARPASRWPCPVVAHVRPCRPAPRRARMPPACPVVGHAPRYGPAACRCNRSRPDNPPAKPVGLQKRTHKGAGGSGERKHPPGKPVAFGRVERGQGVAASVSIHRASRWHSDGSSEAKA